MIRNVGDDGSYLYRFERTTGTDLGGYNTVRHAGIISTLEQAASYGVPDAARAADQGTTWAMARTISMGDGRALADGRKTVTVGASALWAVGLVERRERTADETNDELMRDLGRFIAGSVLSDGSVPARYDRATGAQIAGSWSKFYTGEAFWALARLHILFPDEGFDDAALRIAQYLPRRDDIEAWWPPIPDHWAAYGFSTMTRWQSPPELDTEQIAYIERQLELQSVQIRYESTRTESRWTHLTRGRPTLGAGLGTIGEALNQWWIVAQTNDELRPLSPLIVERARCAAGLLVERQVTSDEATEWSDPDRVAGAWFQFDITQMDDQQHPVSALIEIEPLLESQQ